MRRFVLAVVALAVAGSPLWGQEAAKAPKMVIPELVKEFGNVPKGDVIEADFKIQNEGDAPLEIKAVRPTCGCTVADYDREIAPGAYGHIKARVNTADFRGPITKSILVYTNDPETPTVRLVVKAEVVPYVEVLPRPLVRFSATAGEELVKKVTVVSNRGETFEITKVTSSVPYLSATYRALEGDERIGDRKGSQYEVALRLAKDAPVGPVSAEVTVKTSHPKAPRVQIRVFGVVRAQVQVSPSQLQFGAVDPADAPGRNVVVINNRAGRKLQVKSVTVDDPAFEAQLHPIAEGKRYQVTVVVKRDAKPGPHSATLTIVTDDPDYGEVKVPVAANVRPEGN